MIVIKVPSWELRKVIVVESWEGNQMNREGYWSLWEGMKPLLSDGSYVGTIGSGLVDQVPLGELVASMSVGSIEGTDVPKRLWELLAGVERRSIINSDNSLRGSFGVLPPNITWKGGGNFHKGKL